VLRHLRVRPGNPYDPAALEAARADLAGLEAVASVRLIPGDALDAEGRLPVQVRVAERRPRVVSFGAAWSTDQGGSLTASWTHRNLLGHAESLALVAGVTNLAGSAATGPGYRLGARLLMPDWRARGQTLAVSALAVRETLDAYDRTALVLGASVSAQLADRLTASLGGNFTQARVTQNRATRDYSLAQLPLGLRYDSTADKLEPVSGMRAELVVTPSVSLAARRQRVSGDSVFVIAQGSASAYLDLTRAPEGGRSVLALRVNIGSVTGASAFDLPPDQRFYGGGGGTVRGFRYQSLGPAFASGKPEGGAALVAATVELRQRIGESFGAVAFVDAGQVGAGATPFTGKLQSAGGVGGRYYTSIGAIRADIAVPFARQHGGDSFELYLGLGQAF
jgi:translocation and assembly module TamA